MTPMYERLKIPPRPPVDVTRLRKLTMEEQEAQRCDVRSAIAELSADPDRPVTVTDDHPNLGGRRVFLHLFNALYEHVPRVRASHLQRPNMKVLHLHSAAYQWRRASTLYRLLREGDEEVKEEAIERIGMDLMEAAIVAVYSAVAAIDVRRAAERHPLLEVRREPVPPPVKPKERDIPIHGLQGYTLPEERRSSANVIDLR